MALAQPLSIFSSQHCIAAAALAHLRRVSLALFHTMNHWKQTKKDRKGACHKGFAQRTIKKIAACGENDQSYDIFLAT